MLKNMTKRLCVSAVLCLVALSNASWADEKRVLDEVTREQAALERKQMQAGKEHEHSPAMAAYRKSAEQVTYPSGEYKLPGFLYKPAGEGPFPAMIWNHGSEKNPRMQAELARFYTAQGFVFFAPIRHGHAPAPGPYIVDLQNELRDKEPTREAALKKIVDLHDLYNQDVVAAVAWLKEQPFVDRQRMVMSGCSYGGIQTLLSAEKGLGLRAFVPFAPAAMSYANAALRERLVVAARNAKAPVFLLQAQNDYSTGPSELLGPILAARGAPSHAKVYPAFGSTNAEGHGGFACRSLGVTNWGDDVLDFLTAAIQQPAAADGR